MANAAAKKAALAKNNTSSIYLPLIVLLNVVHLILLYSLSKSFSTGRIVLLLLEWVGTYIAYQGILHDAEIGQLARDNNKKTDITGGIYLDALGLIIFCQYGAIFIGDFVSWLLLIVPISYLLFKWISSRKASSADSSATEEDEGMKKDLEERRRKRAERRKQKRF